MSQISAVVARITAFSPLFGAFFYFANWAFLAVCVFAVFREARRSREDILVRCNSVWCARRNDGTVYASCLLLLTSACRITILFAYEWHVRVHVRTYGCSMYVCMCVCMSVYVCTCVSVRVYARVCALKGEDGEYDDLELVGLLDRS